MSNKFIKLISQFQNIAELKGDLDNLSDETIRIA